ncbi:hypothetical protein PR001_g422 [Phytophthora rubi]|uniref:Secreted protein n=1 Tax=Phytophthora rubi TaxID=129364 RepID=A0A6A3PDK0_9STRA|nr:hypothetical protein PR001_g422 [Phytophthora rubi]
MYAYLRLPSLMTLAPATCMCSCGSYSGSPTQTDHTYLPLSSIVWAGRGSARSWQPPPSGT